MAGFSERISVVIDVVTKNAQDGLKGFKKSVGEAEGVTGKLKAGTKSLGGMFSSVSASPAAMAGGIAAAGTAALAAVQQFSDLGVEIGKFSDATGLSVEESSRWVETANDLGIETSTLESLIGKLNKNIDPKKFADLGIAISHTATGATDVNATFLNVIQRLHEIQDPAERARVGAQLLGKGWQSAAELIGMSAQEIKSRLASVSQEQIMTPEQVQQAKEFRDAQDALLDVFKRLTITIGTKLAPALTDVADLASKAGDAFGWLNDLDRWMTGGKNAIDGIGEAASYAAETADSLWDSWYEFTFGADKATATTTVGIDTLNQSIQATDYASRLAAAGNSVLAEKMGETADAAAQVRDKVGDARREIEMLKDDLSEQKGLVDTKLNLLSISDQLATVAKDYKDKKMSTEEYFLRTQQLGLDGQSAIADYITSLGDIPPEVVSKMVSTYDPANPQKTFDEMQAWFNQRKLYIGVVSGFAGADTRNIMEDRGSGASGSGGTKGGSHGSTVNVNVRSMPTQRELTEFINNTRRRQGTVI